jgi:hypothetical protein
MKRSFAFYWGGGSFTSMKHADLRDIFKKAPKSTCTPTNVVFPDHLSPIPSTSLAIEIPENVQETSITLNQQMKEIST